MTANLHQPTLQKMADRGERSENGDSYRDGKAERSNPSLQRMWEIVRNRPYAVLESSAGDTKIDNMIPNMNHSVLASRMCSSATMSASSITSKLASVDRSSVSSPACSTAINPLIAALTIRIASINFASFRS